MGTNSKCTCDQIDEWEIHCDFCEDRRRYFDEIDEACGACGVHELGPAQLYDHELEEIEKVIDDSDEQWESYLKRLYVRPKS